MVRKYKPELPSCVNMAYKNTDIMLEILLSCKETYTLKNVNEQADRCPTHTADKMFP